MVIKNYGIYSDIIVDFRDLKEGNKQPLITSLLVFTCQYMFNKLKNKIVGKKIKIIHNLYCVCSSIYFYRIIKLRYGVTCIKKKYGACFDTIVYYRDLKQNNGQNSNRGVVNSVHLSRDLFQGLGFRQIGKWESLGFCSIELGHLRYKLL